MSFKETMKPILDPVADALFGKYRGTMGRRPAPEAPKPRPVGSMMRDLLRVDEAGWGTYAFSRDPLNRKVTPEQRLELTKKANACGREYAQKMARQYGTSKPSELAKQMGMSVEYPDMPKNTARVLFAEYQAPNHIYLYMDAVHKARATMIEPGVKDVLTDRLDIGELLLAHELFHHVEEMHKKEIFTAHGEDRALGAEAPAQPLHARLPRRDRRDGVRARADGPAVLAVSDGRISRLGVQPRRRRAPVRGDHGARGPRAVRVLTRKKNTGNRPPRRASERMRAEAFFSRGTRCPARSRRAGLLIFWIE